MKKLMILAAAAMVAGMSQAAQFKWMFTTSKTGGAGYSGATVYMVLTADVPSSIATVADISKAAKSQGTLTLGSMSGTTGAITVNDSWVTEGTDYKWYAYVVSGDKYFKSLAETTSTAVGDTSAAKSGTYASQAQLQTASNWTTFSSVPEPTSGLLLLLGMAGLALKRKIA